MIAAAPTWVLLGPLPWLLLTVVVLAWLVWASEHAPVEDSDRDEGATVYRLYPERERRVRALPLDRVRRAGVAMEVKR